MSASPSPEPFTVIDSPSPPSVFPVYTSLFTAKAFGIDSQLTSGLHALYPELVLTKTFANNCDLLDFAFAGHATAELDITTDSIARFRGFVPGYLRGQKGSLGDAISFAKYHYNWAGEDFIVYIVQEGYTFVQYILKEAGPGETQISHSKITDALISAIGEWQASDDKVVYVFDRYWTKSRALWNEVQKASWDDVILDARMKKTLTEVVGKFFDSKNVYEELGVPWKRGLIFYGPAGNGKTISIKAIMNTLSVRKNRIPTLYVKSAPSSYSIREVWVMARRMAPCLLILEDIDTIVTERTRSYAFNEIDGLENNDGILMIASTNHLEILDPGLTKRPSRFDRKYLFPLPSKNERILYCAYWRQKLRNKPTIAFPKKLCLAIAGITQGFSFAYLKEAFISTLLVMAGNHQSEDDGSGAPGETDVDHDDSDDLDDYELWREMKNQVKLLRDDMESKTPSFEPRTLHRGHDQERREGERELSSEMSEPTPQIGRVTGDGRPPIFGEGFRVGKSESEKDAAVLPQLSLAYRPARPGRMSFGAAVGP